MKTTDIVINKINRFKNGYVFTYSDFDIPVGKVEALKKSLSRLVASGKIVRLSKGQFYKPETSQFGTLRPTEYQVVKDLLETDNKVIGYLTGLSIFNNLGLTTQVSNTIQIGTNIEKNTKRRGKYIIRFLRQRNTITRENLYLLQILDSIRLIKKIPDTSIKDSIKRLSYIIQSLSNEDKKTLRKLALKYNPGTRALAGAILDQTYSSDETKALLESLRVTSTFKYNIPDEVLTNKKKWKVQ
jgi:hypothetical protein